MISQDTHPNCSHSEQDPATRGQWCSRRRGAEVLKNFREKLGSHRGDLATEAKSSRKGGSGRSGAGEASWAAGIGGPRVVLPTAPKAGSWVSVTAHGNGSNNPHTSVNSSVQPEITSHQKIREGWEFLLDLKGRANENQMDNEALLFLIFGHNTWHMGPQFPDQGLNPRPFKVLCSQGLPHGLGPTHSDGFSNHG